ncbi:major facilitator superfamily protein [Kipferlia bialata]|uniref:Major facilitator superfamily protein n=1 Tax=Kipferlia bialata TaxID=797122 RepID=A0A9K3CPC0_9EUKA|nr:major facilitator superfamily protein [Kipferlia bialata]|eukprot:g777.t1
MNQPLPRVSTIVGERSLVSVTGTGLIIPFACGNFLGSFILGRTFDTLGRKKAIFIMYSASALLLTLDGILFECSLMSTVTQTIAFSCVFFVASPAASSGYLTIAEVFPIEFRSMAIALFYSLGTGFGGITGPLIFGSILDTNNRTYMFYGYLSASILMMVAAVTELKIGVDAENKSLEEIAPPLKGAAKPSERDHLGSEAI